MGVTRCGVRDRRPLDPPPVVRLRLYEVRECGPANYREEELTNLTYALYWFRRCTDLHDIHYTEKSRMPGGHAKSTYSLYRKPRQARFFRVLHIGATWVLRLPVAPMNTLPGTKPPSYVRNTHIRRRFLRVKILRVLTRHPQRNVYQCHPPPAATVDCGLIQ